MKNIKLPNSGLKDVFKRLAVHCPHAEENSHAGSDFLCASFYNHR